MSALSQLSIQMYAIHDLLTSSIILLYIYIIIFVNTFFSLAFLPSLDIIIPWLYHHFSVNMSLYHFSPRSRRRHQHDISMRSRLEMMFSCFQRYIGLLMSPDSLSSSSVEGPIVSSHSMNMTVSSSITACLAIVNRMTMMGENISPSKVVRSRPHWQWSSISTTVSRHLSPG